MNSLLPCPKCGCPDQLSLDSNSNAEASWIECGWCEHRMQRRSDEETLADEWNEVSRENMPAFDLEAELVKLDKAPSQPGCEACARLRRTADFWYDRAKKAERTLAQQPAAVDGACGDACAHIAIERDMLLANNERLAEALRDLLSWFPEKPAPSEWRILAGEQGADDAIEYARAALTPTEATDREP